MNLKLVWDMNTEDLVGKIKGDTSSGASEIMKKTVESLLLMSSRLEEENPGQYFDKMTGFGCELISAQPAMAPVFSTVNIVILAIESGIAESGSSQELQQRVKDSAIIILDSSREALAMIREKVLELVKEGQTVLTHSYSSTVIGSLINAHKKGKDFEVFVTESRPLFEGRRTAQLLSEAGIDVTLIADMAAFYYINDCDIIITGCDCICQKGTVNKVGTKGLAVCASQFNVPFFVISEMNKVLPAKYRPEPQIVEMNQDEIWEEPGEVAVKNVYFDVTPHSFINGYITEEGVIGPSEVLGIITQAEVSQKLIEKLA